MQELRQIAIIAAEFGSQKNVFKGLSGLYIVSPYTGKSQRFGLYFLHSFATFFGFSTICCCRHLILKQFHWCCNMTLMLIHKGKLIV